MFEEPAAAASSRLPYRCLKRETFQPFRPAQRNIARYFLFFGKGKREGGSTRRCST
jgi:hypothetical protein